MSKPNILDLISGNAPLPKLAAGSPQGVTVTKWTVGYDATGHLTAQCLVTPDSGVDISFCTIVMYTQGFGTVIAGGGGGLNDYDEPGVGSVWGADAITGVYPQGKGTTITCRIIGFSTFGDPGVFLFDQDFKI